MNTHTKIVFAHDRYSWYLPYVLYQAKFASPHSEIVLLGNQLSIPGIHCERLEDLHNENIDKFHNNYKHMSSNPERYEKFCWLRWFYLLEYMRSYNIQLVWHFDSDVLLYSSIEEIEKIYSDILLSCGYLIPKQDFDSFTWCAFPNVSYWTFECLKDFCEFALNSFCDDEYLNLYQKKWDFHIRTKTPGGICDMTTLYLFWRERSKSIANLAIEHNSNVFDININTGSNYYPNEYVTYRGKKKIEFLENKPVLFNVKNKKKLIFSHTLHFQADAKRKIPLFYTGNSFKDKRLSDAFNLLRLGKGFLITVKKKYFSCS